MQVKKGVTILLIMTPPYQLYITLKKDYFTPTELISGTVHLKILTSMHIDNISLKLTKQIRITDLQTIYTHKFNLFRPENPFKISAGHHVYPFSFYLNSNDNASIDSTINLDVPVHIENKYILSADVKIYGVYMPVINSTEYINIIDDNVYESKIIKKIMFNSCFCLIRRYSKFVSQLDKVAYYSGENINLRLECETKIKSVGVYLYQLVSLQHERLKTNYALLYEDERCIDNKIANIKVLLDSTCPSTASEQFYDVKYIIQVVVRFERRANIQYNHDVFVIKRRHNLEEKTYLDCLSGIEANMQYFTLQ